MRKHTPHYTVPDPWWDRLRDWRGFHRIACAFGHHHHKLSSYSRTGLRGGCIYCGKDLRTP